MEATSQDKDVVWLLGPKQLTDTARHCFGPWDVFSWDGEDWCREGTYYYLEDIPDSVWKNKYRRVVPLGKEAWWPPSEEDKLPDLYFEKLSIRLDKE